MQKLTVQLFFLFLCSLIFTDCTVRAEAKRVEAKIGIEILSGQRSIRAGSREMIKPGDRIRIYIHSSESTNVYVVYSNNTIARLLNMTIQKTGESTLCLPSAHSYYKVDGQNPMERFTIVCSPWDMPELSAMADSGIPWNRWSAIEKDLVRESKIELTRPPEPIIEIAGNVRGDDETGEQSRFVGSLPIFSGKGLLVKTYEFKVQKRN